MASNDRITPSLRKIRQAMTRLPEQAAEVFVANTPKRSGRARRSTRLRGTTIHADYPYATRLEAGSSRQNPQGMVRPTTRFIERQMNKIIRK